MTQLLFDLAATQPNSSGKRHGGGIYGEVIFRRIIELGFKPICYYNGTKWLNSEIVSLIQDNSLPLYDINTTSLDEIVKKEQISKLYSCLPTLRELKFKGCKVVGTIHGLRNLELPMDSFRWKYRKEFTIKNIVKWRLKKILHYNRNVFFYNSNIIENLNFDFITVSNHSAMSFKIFFPNYPKNIKVFYSPSTSSTKMLHDRKYTDKFFLMVSGNRWEKNNLRAIIALDRLFSYGYLNDYKVLVSGASDSSIYRYKIQKPNKFSFVGYVDDQELEQLYHDAYAFIYPSLNEGFGYPPLQAMRYGVPVLASPFAAISEVCEGAVLYFNPFSIEEIMNRILMITDDNCHQRIASLSLEQYSKITNKQKEDLDKLIDFLYN